MKRKKFNYKTFLAIFLILISITILSVDTMRAKYTKILVVTDDLNLTIGEYKLTLDANGGLINNQSVIESTFSSGDVYGELPVPTKEGYKFQGWFSEKDGGTQISETDIINQNDTVIYAHWYSKYDQPIKIRYENVDGTFAEPVVVTTKSVFPGDTFTWNVSELDSYKENSSQWEHQWQTPNTEEYIASDTSQDITIDILRQLYYLDLNGSFYDYDGAYLYGGGNLIYNGVTTATANVDINGKRDRTNVTDYFVKQRYGSTFKFTITAMSGYKFSGAVNSGQPLSNVSVSENVITGIVTGERHVINTTGDNREYDATTVSIKIRKQTS